MFRQWIQRRVPNQAQVIDRFRDRLGNHAIVEKMLNDPDLWQLERRTVAGGVAVGLFVSWLPMPLQTLLAICLSAVMRVHVPVSMAMVWFTNPLTIVPLLYAAWFVGSAFMPSAAVAAHVTDTAQQAGFYGLLDTFMMAWPVLLLGCLMCACITSATGFLLVHLCWRDSEGTPA